MLECDILEKNLEIKTGFLYCSKCDLTYPIIDTIPILWNDFASYLSNRPRLGGEMLVSVKHPRMHAFVKNALSKSRKVTTDASIMEKHWAGIYQKNQKASFYSVVKKAIPNKLGLSLEHGCATGTMTKHLAKNTKWAFGIDKSWYGIREAKRIHQKNLDYIVTDSLEQPFGKTKFDLVMGLNLLELIEPKLLVRLLAGQVQKNGILVLSDPYDFERGEKSIKEPLYENELRREITNLGLVISPKSKRPSFHKWNLTLNKRASLHYLVDLVVAKNIGKS